MRPWTVFIMLSMCVILWIWAGWNIDNSDLVNYKIHFMSQKTYSKLYDDNYGTCILFLTLKNIGLDFFYARILIYGISFIILTSFILRWSYMPIMVFILYFGFHFVKDVVELKNFLGSIAILCCFSYLVYNTKKKRLVAFLLICLAGSFHIAYYLFIPLVFIPTNRTLPALSFLTIFVIASFSSRIIVGQFLKIYSSDFLFNRIDGLMEYTGWGAICASVLVVAGSIIFLHYIHSNIMKSNSDICINQIQFYTYSTIIYNINVASTFLLVFSSITFSFIGRLYSTITIINIVYITNYLWLKRNRPNLLEQLMFIIYYLCVLNCLSMYESHYIDVFTKNLIFNN